jgi:hypothetical protein
MPSYVFISYSTRDSFARDAIYKALMAHQIDVWLDKDKLRTGDTWTQKLELAVKNSDIFLLLVSPDSKASKWVLEELTVAQDTNKKIIPILVAGTADDAPFGVKRLQFFDLREASEDKLNQLANFIRELQQLPQIDHTAPANLLIQPKIQPTQKVDLRLYPIPLKKMITIQRILEAAAEEIATPKVHGRASLIWLDEKEQDLYIAVATSGGEFADQELRFRFKKGQGIAGEIWQRNHAQTETTYIKDIQVEKMRDVWKFTEEEINYTQQIEFIISLPIYRDNGFIGILSVDRQIDEDNIPINNTKISNESKRNLETIRDTLAQIIGDIDPPISFRQYRSLTIIPRTSRLIPDYDIPVRAGVFVINQANDRIYLAAGFEEFLTRWSYGGISFRKGEALVGQVWAKGDIQKDDRTNKSKSEICGEWNMTDDMFKIAEDTKSIVGIPITDKDGQIIGVLVVDSPRSESEAKLQDGLGLLYELTQLASKILTIRVNK